MEDLLPGIEDVCRVPEEKLQNVCNEMIFPFETTTGYTDLEDEIIGQPRAVEAMEFGLSVSQSGYNIFVAGPAGTGRTTFTRRKAKQFADKQPVPCDWCYVNNFENPDQPVALSFPSGQGPAFCEEMDALLSDIENELIRIFSSDEYTSRKNGIIHEFESKVESAWKELTQYALDMQYKVERTPTGINSYPLRFNRPLEPHEYQRLTDDMKEELKVRGRKVEEKINETLHTIQKIEKEMRTNLEEYMQETANYATDYLFAPLLSKYSHQRDTILYLELYRKDISKNFPLLLNKEGEENPMLEILAGTENQKKRERYFVNLLVSNPGKTGAPIIYETNPTYSNLFGKVEYKGSFGNWSTDFTRIKAGSLHRANGGYLIMQVADLLSEPYVWTMLKRTLQNGSITPDGLIQEKSPFATAGLRPKAIPLNVKVILIGSHYLFDMLSLWDEDFQKQFKVKVEFDIEMERDLDHHLQMASFIKTFSDNEGLLPFHRRAIARIIDHSSRLVADQRKLSTRFQDITKILVESSYWARRENSEFADRVHVQKALAKQHYRSNRVAEKLREMIMDGTIMVDTDGKRIGQINGLAVMGTRDFTFGLPSRITAQTYAGRRGILNIERETSLSGDLHSKGLLILSGYLSGMFAQNRPLPLSASITFEQTYNMIDGDSASSTELYVLLSSLARVPIKQGVAVTGSVNQWGEIQPIGGVNEKIEGFFFICKEKGLTGKQGVIIPHQNVKNLMLDDEVAKAVKNGEFHIWAIKNVTEGIEILTGIPAGPERNEGGQFEKGTIFRLVEERLEEMYKTAIKSGSQQLNC
ncbi:Lon protease family protein [Bacillus marinisedimentorum]|uniref:Lon protease family protein n=1 Tax=Bacillus marinisedimentorum TaxID=1821260 RepID=UPI0008729A8B|nr:ATP-binding protein [Bacillus marinisedimentorum]